MPNWTPGPWFVDSAGDVCAGEFCVSITAGPWDEQDLEANARLIAAAPELLEALQNLLAVHNGEGGTRYHAGDIARAAIAKATES